ncbi:MAG: DUF503 domain-containing protein [Anaerohalosphaera sp.]|nr:DUF503 domain-containing protein [Anaerohalosphaera sp.]
MLIGAVTITINLPGISSLKQKRAIVKSLIERLKNRFNFAVAEVAKNDSKQQAVIGLSTVSNDGIHIEKQIDKLIDFTKADGRFFISTIQREIFPSEN